MGRIIKPGQEGKAKQSIEFDISWDLYEKEEKKLLEKYSKTLNVPGFRRGKVPIDIIKLRYGPEVEKEASENVAIREAIKRISQMKYDLVGDVNIKILKFKPGEGLKVRAEFEIIPEFALPDLTKIKVFKRIKRITSADVMKVIEKYRRTLADLKPVDRPVEEGDYLIVDYKEYDKNSNKLLNSIEDVPIDFEWGKIDATLYNALRGKKKGDVVKIERKLALEGGKELPVIQVYKIKEVKEVRYPNLDDNFARSFGYKNFEEMKEGERKQLEEKVLKDAEKDMEWEIIDKIYDMIKFEIPEGLVKSYEKIFKKEFSNKKLSPDINMEIREWSKNLAKRYVILKRVAEYKNLEPSEKEIEEEIRKRAKEYKADFEEYKKKAEQTGEIENIKDYLRNKKALEYLKNVVKVEVVFE